MPISTYNAGIRAHVGHQLLMSPGVAAVIRNERGEVLLQRRSDNGQWGLPGGAIDPGEAPADAAVREVYEETGLHVLPDRVIGVYGGPDLEYTYPNGDQVAVIGIVFAVHVTGGELTLDGDETLELRYFSPDALPNNLFHLHNTYIAHAADPQPVTHFAYAGVYYP